MEISLSVEANKSLARFCCQYLQLHLPLDYPSDEYLSDAAFQAAMYERLFREDAIQHPPPIRYQHRILKELVKRIEQSIQDWNAEV